MLWSGVPLFEHVLHPLGLLERLRGIAVKLDADCPLARLHVAQLALIRADCGRLDEAVVGARALERVREDASLARLDGLARLTILHRDRVQDILSSMRRDGIGRDVEE